jgi:DNA-binding MarR family transcriptional regulator
VNLTGAQIAHVVREASVQTRPEALLSGVASLSDLQVDAMPLLCDESYSRSLLRGLLMLVAFPCGGDYRRLTDVTRALGLSPSTAHRYAQTLVAVGLLEQEPRSRRYRRPASKRPL